MDVRERRDDDEGWPRKVEVELEGRNWDATALDRLVGDARPAVEVEDEVEVDFVGLALNREVEGGLRGWFERDDEGREAVLLSEGGLVGDEVAVGVVRRALGVLGRELIPGE